jgi:multimeric flavodoxin WrbA
MTSIAIVYHSGFGTTHQLALAIKEGAKLHGETKVNLYRILPEHIQGGRFIASEILNSVSKADAIIFGSPTYMGSVSAQFKAFADASSEIWSTSSWSNKIAAGFTIGSHYSGDQLSTIQYFQILAGQHGMLWAGLDNKGLQENNVINPSGAQSGLITCAQNNEVISDDLQTAQYLGKRIALLVNN